MFESGIIVFREVLEAALVLSIVAAATRAVVGRNLWLLLGVATGIAGAVVVAAFAGQIAEAMEGMGQEIFNASVLLLAVGMLGWHNIWMQRHGRQLAAEMHAVGSAAASGSKTLLAVAAAVALAVLREGSEIVLFLYGIAGKGTAATDMLVGCFAGLAIGAAAGWGLYSGLITLSTRTLFAATSWMILLLAAGMAATAAKFLSQADVVPTLGIAVWDTSAVLPDDTIVGELLHVLIGYVSRPSGIQIIFYFATIITIGGLMLLLNSKQKPQLKNIAGPAAAVLAISLLAQPQPAHAGFKVYTPYVEYHELEIEYRPSVTVDGDDAKDNGQEHLVGIGYGVTEWWFTELYAEWEREAGSAEDTVFEALEWENRFQLTNPGEYWADAGLLIEYKRKVEDDAPDKIEVGALFAKEIGNFNATYNLVFSKEIGSHASSDVELEHAFQLKYRASPAFEPGIELYSEFGAIGDMPGFDEQEHFIGPVVEGKVLLDDSGTKLKYNAGYLFGLTDETPDGAFKAIIELEFPL